MFVLSNPFRPYTHPSLRRNPVSTTTIIVASAATLLGLGVAGYAYAKSKKKPLPPPPGTDLPCDPSPYEVEIDAIEIFVNQQIDAGETDKATVAQNTADEFFGRYPGTQQVIVFPPGPTAAKGVACAWQIVIIVVDDIFKKRNVPTGPEEPPLGSLDWVVHHANDPNYPWEEPSLQAGNFPTPGTWIDIGNKDQWDPAKGLDSMVRAALGSALAMAGGDITLANEGDPRTRSKQLKAGLRNAIIVPNGVNDLTYGQTNANYAGGNDPDKPGGNKNKGKVTYMMNSAGRGLNWDPRHADNLARIPQGLPLKRTTKLNGEKLGGANSGNQQMLVWIPAISLDALTGPVPVIAFTTWSDGSSTLHPPPQIQALGVDRSGVVIPGTHG